MLIDAAKSTLLVIDVQTRLAPVVHQPDACIERCRILIEAARRLAIPTIASEQYPKGLGPLVPELAALVPPAQIHDKRHFSCIADAGIASALLQTGRGQIVICGMEAHVCVLQSALELKAQNFAPVVVADAVATRRPASHALALERLRAHRVEVVDSEMVLFEWLRLAGTPEFKALAPLIK